MAKKASKPENQPAPGGDPVDVQVRLPTLLVRHAGIIADSRHLKLKAYLTMLLEPLIERDLPAALKKLNLPTLNQED